MSVAAARTRQYVFDVNATGYLAGDYVAIGLQNVRVPAAPFRVAP